MPQHIIIVQVERQGYHCSHCNRVHRLNEPPFWEHVGYDVEGPTFWTETRGWAEVGGQWVPISATTAERALREARDAEAEAC